MLDINWKKKKVCTKVNSRQGRNVVFEKKMILEVADKFCKHTLPGRNGSWRSRKISPKTKLGNSYWLQKGWAWIYNKRNAWQKNYLWTSNSISYHKQIYHNYLNWIVGRTMRPDLFQANACSRPNANDLSGHCTVGVMRVPHLFYIS